MTRAAVPVLARKAGTAIRLPPTVVALLPLAWLLLAVTALAIRVAPFRRLAPLLGTSLGAVRFTPLAGPAQLRAAETIGRAVTIAGGYAPFRSDCLRQALAAAILCRCAGVPHVAYLGAAVDVEGRAAGLTAHAWVSCGRVAVTGGVGNHRRYGIVACFLSTPGRKPDDHRESAAV